MPRFAHKFGCLALLLLLRCGNPLGSFEHVDPEFSPEEELEEAVEEVEETSEVTDDPETTPEEEGAGEESAVETPHGSGDPDVTLSSGILTRLESATISITCGGAVRYMVASTDTLPGIEDSQWISCPADSFDADVSLSGGTNTFHVWFRDTTQVLNATPFSFTVNRAFFFQFTDPDPVASGQFGGQLGVIRLSNGNYIIPAPGNSEVASTAGAVHLYGKDGTYIKSIYGERANDQLGKALNILPNGNFVAASNVYDSGGVMDTGVAILVDGSTGNEIGRIAGSVANDGFDIHILSPVPGIRQLTNNNFIIKSEDATISGNADAGTVILASGVTGAELGRISGDDANDKLGGEGVVVLANNNVVICTLDDDGGAVTNAGSAILMNGGTGAEISRINGDDVSDTIASGCVTELSNSNYIIKSPQAIEGGNATAGHAMLVNGTTGVEIGRITGDSVGDRIATPLVVALTNGHYVVGSQYDDTGIYTDNGSVRLVNGTTGTQIGTAITGTENSEIMGTTVVALTNGNYVIGASNTDNGAVNAAGAAILVNGTTGTEIARVSGASANDRFGDSIVALTNGNFVAMGSGFDDGATTNAGTAVLINGTTGVEISRISGASASDGVGSGSAVALDNGNYVLPVQDYDVGAVTDAGVIILVNGTTGAEIARIEGDQANDQCGNALALTGGNFVYACIWDDDDAVDGGHVGLASGVTGALISSLKGDDAGDLLGQGPPTAFSDGNAGWAHGFDDVGGINNSGSAYLILNN